MATARGERLRTGAGLALIGAAVAWMLWPFVLDRALVVERDALSYFLPRSAFLARAMAAGSLPGWNPSAVLGKPFFADWQSASLYPPNLLLLVPPLSRGFNLLFVFHYLWAGVGGFAWLRAIGLPRDGACVGAVVWCLGGALLSLGHLFTLLMAVAWLPWVLLAWERPRSAPRKVALASLTLAIPLLVGAPEVILLIVVALLLIARDPRALLVPFLAGAIAAIQLVPTALYLTETHRAVHGIDPAVALRYSATAAELAQLAFFAGRLDPEPFLPSVYLGPIPCALAAVGFFAATARARALAAAALFVLVVLALGGNTPVLPLLLERLPGASLLRYPEKLLIGVHALLSAAAALGAAALLERVPRGRGALALLLLGLVVADLGRVNRDLLATLPPETVLAAPPAARAMLEASADDLPGTPIRYYANTTGRPVAASPRAEAELDRAILFAGTGELYGLADVNTPAALNLLDHERLHRSLGRLGLGAALRLLASFGTRFVTSWQPLAAAPIAEPLADQPARDGPHLLRLAAARPLAYLATQALTVPDPDTLLERLADAEDPGLVLVSDATSLGAPTGPPGSIHWRKLSPDRLGLTVATPGEALLVVNQTDFPGWRAAVDGNPSKIVRVNALVQGIRVGPGEHRVELTYVPPGWYVGLATSCVALGFAAWLLARRADAPLSYS